MKHITIKAKVFILILVLLVPLFLLQYNRIRITYNDKVESELNSSEKYASAMSKLFTNYIEDLWIQESVIGTYLLLNTNLSADEIQSYFDKVLESQDTIVRVNWINPEGTVIASSRSQLSGESLQERSYVQRILNGEDKVVSDMVITVLPEGTPIIPVARAIKKDGKLLGIVSAVIDVEKMVLRLPSSDAVQGSSYGLIDRNGTVVYRSDNNTIPFEKRHIPDNSPSWKALKGEIVRTVNKSTASDPFGLMGVDYPIKGLGWSCFVTSSYESIMAQHEKAANRDISILFLVSLVSVLFAYLIINRILSSFDKLKNAAQKIMLGDYSVRTGISGNDEIAATAYAFDQMAEGIEQYDKLKTQFFSNLSHELKTPLNVIFAASQLLSAQCDKTSFDEYKEEVQKYMKVTKQNCYRLLRLIRNLIDITRYDGGYLKLQLGNYNIIYLVEEITMSVVKYAESKGITVLFDTETEEKIIACDPDFIERIILNLLSNAIKFTNENGDILVTIYDKEDKVVISVKDTGIGIPQDKLNIIFERFRQVDFSLNRNHEGSGIGLSIVKALVEAHNGTISVNSKFHEGTEFLIELPAVQIAEKEQSMGEERYTMPSSSVVERVNIELSDIYSI